MHKNINSVFATVPSNTTKKQEASEVLSCFSKKNIIKWFIAFLEEEGEDIGYSENKIKRIRNRIKNYYGKKNSVNEIHQILEEVDSLFLDTALTKRIQEHIEKNDDKINDFGRDFFYKNGVFSQEKIKKTLLAKIKNNNLSYTAINKLSKSEILDVLQINNKFKDKDNINQRIIGVTGRGSNKIYTLQGDRKARMLDGKLVVQEIEKKKESESEKMERTQSQKEEREETQEAVFEEAKEEGNAILKEDEEEKTDMYIKSKSGKIYKETKDKEKVSLIENGTYVIDEHGQEHTMPIAEDGTIMDICIGNDGETYKIVDYVSAKENTAPFAIVKIRNNEGNEETLRLLQTKRRNYTLQKEIYIKKPPLDYWINNNKITQFIYKLFKKEVKNTIKHKVKEFGRDGDKGIFYYTLYTGEKVNMEDVQHAA